MRVLVPVGLCLGLIASAHSGANRAVHKQNKFPSETGYRLGAIRASKVSASASYGRLPLSFEANRGQTNDQVKFLARGRDYALFLSATEAVRLSSSSRASARLSSETAVAPSISPRAVRSQPCWASESAVPRRSPRSW